MTDQLRQDLGALQARVAMNWSSWDPSKMADTKIGDGNCLLSNIDALLGLSDFCSQTTLSLRRVAMIVALGFPDPRSDDAGWSVAEWNDAQNSNEPVLVLIIKEAIEKLGQRP